MIYVRILSLSSAGSLRRRCCAADEPTQKFLTAYCVSCHAGAEADGGLDLTQLGSDLSDSRLSDGETFRRWVKIHDRLAAGEMPPKDAEQPSAGEKTAFGKAVAERLIAVERARRLAEAGRVPIRRLTRAEYEYTIRDLLSLDGIMLQASLPEDGSAHNFDKNSEALDISHVNLAKYVEAADAALDMAIATQPTPPERQTHRFSLARHIYHILTNGDAVLLRNGQADDEFPPGSLREHVGAHEHSVLTRNSLRRGVSAGVFRHEDESFKPYFYDFAALYPGKYRVQTSFWSFQWDKGQVLPGRGVEAARLSVVQLQDDGRGGGHPSYILGYYDAPPHGPQRHELTTWFNPKDTLGFNAASLAPVVNYSRPGRAMAFTGPGIACDYMEIEGPIHDVWPPEGHRRLFGDLPLVAFDAAKNQPGVTPPKRKLLRQETQAPNKPDERRGDWTVASLWPTADAERLLASFLPRAFRRPVPDEVRKQYVTLVSERLAAGDCFETALRYAYRAALCSPDFLYHLETPEYFDDHALATRLSYFLWCSQPDDVLGQLADQGKLRPGRALQEQVERLLADPKSQRFVDDFLGQWLNLRKIAANDPDRKLYPEFSAYLQDSMIAESRAFFRELIDKNLDARHLVKSDFAMLNEKLAVHYGLTGVSGSQVRRVALPKDCPRGAFLTQAAVLKVTANGTTTSPVPRGAFVMSRLLGKPPEPPPPNIPAVEPDVQGATTIREQLDKHRSIEACAGCHAKIDPPGFALEAFDVIGGARERYRSIGDGDAAPRGLIDRFVPISFKLGPAVDNSGRLPDGRTFAGINEFQTLLAADAGPLLKNLAEQLCVYATGRPIGFGDRAEIAAIVNRTQAKGGGIRTLIHEVVQSRLFLPVGPMNGPRPASAPANVAQTTPTRAAPLGMIAAVTVAAEKPEAEPRRRQVTLRLWGLTEPARVPDLHSDLAALPEVRVVALDEAKQELTLEYDAARLFPGTPADKPVPEDQLLQQLDNKIRGVSRGLFAVKPTLGDKLAALRREELGVTIQDCVSCRLCVVHAALKCEGVEQASFDRKTQKLVYRRDPAKDCDAAVRESLTKSKVALTTPASDKPADLQGANSAKGSE
ncbi:MAG: DUF1592 domain-containing protein [Pirellulales bacterium]